MVAARNDREYFALVHPVVGGVIMDDGPARAIGHRGGNDDVGDGWHWLVEQIQDLCHSLIITLVSVGRLSVGPPGL